MNDGNETKNQPIKFEEITVRIYVDFLRARALEINPQRNLLSKSGTGSYRAALKDLFWISKPLFSYSEKSFRIRFSDQRFFCKLFFNLLF
jgi:hypothetical protein